MSTTAFPLKDCIEWGVATRAAPGQTVCGDLHLAVIFGGGALVAVVDGLGHGDEATNAAQAAIDVLQENAGQSVITLVQQCHEALIKTRGAVMTLASFNTMDAAVSWLSVGNVAGWLLHANPKSVPASESAVLRGGVVGYQLPTLRASNSAVAPGDLLILATDGIGSEFEQSVVSTDSPQQIADRILSRHFKGTDDALALVVRYLGSRHE